MRDTSSWRSKKDLSKDIRAAWRDAGKGNFGVRDLLDVELGLYLLEQVVPDQQPDAVWTLLDGYPIPQAIGFDLDERQRQMIRVGREMLSARRNPYGWRKAIGDYGKVPEHLRGFLLSPDGLGFQRRSLRVAPHRFEVFEQTLMTLPKFQTATVKTAIPGPYLVAMMRIREIGQSCSPVPHLVGVSTMWGSRAS